ncbi:transcriptional activator protein DAL81 [Pseudohyphozyma bogoriensis]|nr:transcriptional activator protein DAL81 [Pseudohyphozyma bogoriensis]
MDLSRQPGQYQPQASGSGTGAEPADEAMVDNGAGWPPGVGGKPKKRQPPALDPDGFSRPLRSRKQRPCDSCRKMKQRCAIPVAGEPCVECNVDKDETGKGTMEPCAVTSLLTDDLLPIRTVSVAGEKKKAEVGADGEREEEFPHHRQVSRDASEPVFLVFTPTPAHRRHQDDPTKVLLRRLQSTLALLPSYSTESSFADYLSAHPAFPLLSCYPRPSIASLSPGVLSFVLASSLIHSTARNVKNASAPVWEIIKESRVADVVVEKPHLEGISVALMELSGRPLLDPRGDFLLLAKAIAQAQLLGLHISCEEWAIPQWEKHHRSRLWWCLRIHDAWSSFLNSRPSHLQIGNTSTPLPPSPSEPSNNPTLPVSPAFYYLCRLAVVVARMQSEISTIDKLKMAKLGYPTVLKVVETELEALTEETRDLLRPVGGRVPEGAYCFRFLLLGFKCMVRRIEIELKAGIGGPFQPDASTLTLFVDIVDFITTLGPDAFHGFWLPYSCHVLSSVVSSLVRLSLASISSGSANSTPAITISANHGQHPTSLLSRICLVLGNAKAQHGWDVAEWALARAKNVAEKLKTISDTMMAAGEPADEYLGIVNALEKSVAASPSSQALPITTPSPVMFGAGVSPSAAGLGGAGGGGGGGSGTDESTPHVGEILWNVDSNGLPDLDQWLNDLNMMASGNTGVDWRGMEDDGGLFGVGGAAGGGEYW